MIHFFKSYEVGKGYIVNRMNTDQVPSVQKVRCFGDRQTDAIEFSRDCAAGIIIQESRVNLLIRTYSDTPYQYLGKGRLRKQQQ